MHVIIQNATTYSCCPARSFASCKLNSVFFTFAEPNSVRIIFVIGVKVLESNQGVLFLQVLPLGMSAILLGGGCQNSQLLDDVRN